MLIQVDRGNGHIIQKVVSPKGLVGYQAVPEGVHEASQVRRFNTLTEARGFIGKTINHPVTVTVPKAELPHNQKGYKATSGKGKKEKS